MGATGFDIQRIHFSSRSLRTIRQFPTDPSNQLVVVPQLQSRPSA